MKHLEFFYTKPENISNTHTEIKGDELKHLSRVLRKKVRDVVEVIDGQGNLYTVILTEITKQVAIGEIQKRVRYAGEPNFKLTLAQAIPKSSRFEMVIEKGTELGVSTFVPLICKHSVTEGTEAKVVRWQKIAISAMKQCTRSVLPVIEQPQTIEQAIKNKSLLQLGLIANAGDRVLGLSAIINDLKSGSHPLKSATILIGPEGGFTHDEVNLAIENGFKSFTLGQRRLRSETAGIVSVAIMMELLENA